MRKAVLISLLTVSCLHAIPRSNTALVDELIRRKIENLPVFRTLNREYEIYCIPSVREVYINHNFEPFWSDEGDVRDLISAIERCGEEGLNPADYHLDDVNELKDASAPIC